MRRHWRLVKMALRAAIWSATAEPPAIGFAGVAFWSVLAAAAIVGVQYLEKSARFTEYGLGLTVGWLMLSVAVIALVLPARLRAAATAAALIVSTLAAVALGLFLEFVSPPKDLPPKTFLIGLALAAGAYMLWMVGAYAAIVRSFGGARLAGFARAGAILAAQLAVLVAYPNYPAFVTKETYNNPFNSWTYVRAYFGIGQNDDAQSDDGRLDRTRIELAQPSLMERAAAQLAPQVRGETDVYAIGIAGWSEQDVFIKELTGALAALEKVLPVRQRTIRLVNHADTVWKEPAAVLANVAAAVRAVGRTMNKDEDVLLLFMTSHGGPGAFALRMPGLVEATLSPRALAEVLDGEGIRNRIVIVSSCYAGAFVAPLADDNTIVLTAADSRSTSFGCSNEREWTYFGDALFNRNLTPEVSLEEAFLNAKVTIGQWEARDGLTPSNPQGHFGPALTAKLARIYGVNREAREARTPVH
jgi:hypothetical protein